MAALGTVAVFNVAKQKISEVGAPNLDGSNFKVAVLDPTVTPAVADVTPTLSDYTEVGTAGTYVAGGLAATFTWSESGGTVTFALAASPAVTWASDASNDTDARWLLIYETVGGNAVAFIDLESNRDMTAGPLTLNAGTAFTLA